MEERLVGVAWAGAGLHGFSESLPAQVASGFHLLCLQGLRQLPSGAHPGCGQDSALDLSSPSRPGRWRGGQPQTRAHSLVARSALKTRDRESWQTLLQGQSFSTLGKRAQPAGSGHGQSRGHLVLTVTGPVLTSPSGRAARSRWRPGARSGCLLSFRASGDTDGARD